ncbi:hypothetical protein GDO86_015944 [Hymenochirus boettgeri]|uniref:Serpin domain-containing protein n=1 Tax=Hymenochirus boettgeri TaxID=247094 RepID=A0A8T2JXI4_9PIPI|nr:hypothetical protein GDO86_015944 [Hymenochirus boettgeri]
MHFFFCLSLFITLISASDADYFLKYEHRHRHNQQEHKHGCREEQKPQKDKDQCSKDKGRLTEIEKSVADGNSNFALTLFKKLTTDSEKSPKQNVFFSPLSVSLTFSMISLGAKAETHKQILECLSLKQAKIKENQVHETFKHLIQELNDPKNNYKLNIGNSLFIKENVEILKSFENDLKNYYQADVVPTNFQDSEHAKQQLNDYVQNKTHGKIKEIIQNLDSDTEMVLMNYVLYKGEWAETFAPILTQRWDFSIDAVTKVKVPMMNRMGLYKTYKDKDRHCDVIELPYKNETVMLVVVPELGKINEVSLTWKDITHWSNNLINSFVDLYMPKFSVSSKLSLKDTLSHMGITNIFTDNADLSGISEKVKLKVSKASHSAVLDVNEYGTEAVGATSANVIPTKLFPSFTVDRPFLLIIYNNALDSFLFMGKVMDPTEN